MRISSFHHQRDRCSLVVMLIASLLPVLSNVNTHAAAPITPSGLNTQVSQPVVLPSGQTQYNITGGTRPGGGTNLFHSFGDFNVPTNNIANFLNSGSIGLNGAVLPPNLPTTNILGRINGGNPSSIFGMIQTNGQGGFGNANLFLMNPAGFLFGPNATLSVGGMVAFTTADYIRLNDNARFNAVAGPADLLLTAAPVAAFGFLGSNPAAIAIQGSILTVAQGQSLSFVGGNRGFNYIDPDTGTPGSVPGGVTMTGGSLSAPGGQINLASVASPGEVLHPSMTYAPNVNGESFTGFGNVNISQGATLDVSGDGGGTIRIVGGQLIADQASFNASTLGNVDGAATAVSINMKEDVTLTNGSAINLFAGGTGRLGDIEITGRNVTFDGGSTITTINFDSPGGGGNITSNSQTLNLIGGSTWFAGTFGAANSGAINITATDSVRISGDLSSGVQSSLSTQSFGTSNSGAIKITTQNATVENLAFISTDSVLAKGGDITIQGVLNQPADSLSVLSGGLIGATGANGSGTITINAKNVTVRGDADHTSQIQNSGFGEGGTGDILMPQTERLVVADNARINLVVEDLNPRGSSIIIAASESVTLSNDAKIRMEGSGGGILNLSSPTISIENNSALQTISGVTGDSAAIFVRTNNLTLSGGSQLNSSTSPDGLGNGGPVTIQGFNSPATSVTIQGTNSGIVTETNGEGTGGAVTVLANLVQLSDNATISAKTTSIGKAGDILVKADTFSMNTGATITASSTGSGNAGRVTIEGVASPAQSVLIDGFGSGIFTETQGSGAGGNIFINANSVTLQNGGTLSAATSGSEPSATGGTITIAATDVQLVNNALITADTIGAGNAGAIMITANDKVSLQNSLITSTSVFSNGGSGGPVTITSPTVELRDNSSIATLAQGFGSDFSTASAGAVTITASNSIALMNSFIDSSTADTAGNAGQISLTSPSVSLTNGSRVSSAATNSAFSPDGSPIGLSTDGNSGVVEIAAQHLLLADGSVITTQIGSGGQGGSIILHGVSGPASSAEDITIRSRSQIITTALDLGSAGNINVDTARLTIADGGEMQANTLSAGAGGTITIHATEQVTISGEALFCSTCTQGARTKTSQLSTSSSAGGGAPADILGQAGDILIETPSLSLTDGGRILASTNGAGTGGTVTVQGLQGNSATSFLASGHSSEGVVSGIFTDTQGTGAGGNIHVNANSVTLQNGATLSAKTSGTASSAIGGTITVEANTVQLNIGALISAQTSGEGDAGSITLKADVVSMNNGATITASSSGSGKAGSVTIEGTASPAQSVLIDGSGSGITTDTQGTGAGGNILVNADTVTLQNGGILSATTSGTDTSAMGGTIMVNANQVQLTSGALITASTTGAGAGGSITIDTGSSFASNAGTVSSTATQATGGDINISAGQSVTLDNSSLITASSTGAGNAGNIVVNAGQHYASTNSSVTTKAEQASGGNITVLATGLVHLTNSEINASVEGSSTTVGGNILIDPVYVILQNSQILAQATQGQGGNINIFYTGALLTDSSSVISASSQFGQSGTVTFQSPNAPASGKIQPLGKSPLLSSTMFNQRCAALAGGNFSSFTVAGRDSLPTEPGGWLSSPLALRTTDSNGTLTEASPRTSQAYESSETPLLSLRQMVPPGFLTQAFAVESSGCQS